MPLLSVFVVYVPTETRYGPFAADFLADCGDEKSTSGAHNTRKSAKTLLVIFMRLAILLLFFFVFFLQDGGGGDGIVFFQPQQANALRGATGLANFVRVNADDFAVVRDNHHIGLFRHLQRGNDVPIAVRGFHVYDAFAAP